MKSLVPHIIDDQIFTREFKSVVGDGALALIETPKIQDSGELWWHSFLGEHYAKMYDCNYPETSGLAGSQINLASTTFNSMLFWTKPATTTEALAEIDTGGSNPTIDLVSDEIVTANFTNETVFTTDKGDWKVVGVTFDELTAPATMAKVGQTYGQAGWFNILQFSKTGGMTQSDFDWLVAHPNATAVEIKAQLGISDLNYMPCSECAGDYVVDVGQELGSELIQDVNYQIPSRWDGSGTVSNGQAILGDGEFVFPDVGFRADFTKGYYSVDVNIESTNEHVWIYINNVNGGEIFITETGKYIIESLLDNQDAAVVVRSGAIGSVVNSISIKKIITATLSGCTWQTGQATGRHTALDAFNTSEINGETILLQDVGNGKDVLGNDITITDFMLNVFPGTYGTFTPITISRNAGFIMVDFEVRDWVAGNTNGYQSLLSKALSTNSFIVVDADNGDIISESDTDTDIWTNDSAGVSTLTPYRLLQNTDSGTVRTYLSTDGSDWVLIDTQTPSDDITLSQIINSVTSVQSNVAINSVISNNKTLEQSQMEYLRTV